MTDEARADRSSPARTGPTTIGRTLRWLLGAGSLLAGFTWMLINLNNPSALVDAVVGCVLVAGGLVLLMPHRITLPRRATALAMIVFGLVGTGAGLTGSRQITSDVYYVIERGWPFFWAQRGAVGPDTDTARHLAAGTNWRVDLVPLAGTLLFFAYVGMLLIVVAVTIRQRRQSSGRGDEG